MSDLREALATALHAWGYEGWRVVVRDDVTGPTDEQRRLADKLASHPAVLATLSDPGQGEGLDAAWAEAEAALPEGWVPLCVSPSEDWAAGDVPKDDPQWVAGSCSLAFFNGETDADDQQVNGIGPTPATALRALAARLTPSDTPEERR